MMRISNILRLKIAHSRTFPYFDVCLLRYFSPIHKYSTNTIYGSSMHFEWCFLFRVLERYIKSNDVVFQVQSLFNAMEQLIVSFDV